jgi:hypothetical protein
MTDDPAGLHQHLPRGQRQRGSKQRPASPEQAGLSTAHNRVLDYQALATSAIAGVLEHARFTPNGTSGFER